MAMEVLDGGVAHINPALFDALLKGQDASEK